MTLPPDLPPELSHSGVRPADRLGFTLFLAALIHLALLLGLGFTFAEPKQITKTLEITLATFKSEKKPEKADFLAQDNQQGSGTLDKKAVPKTTEVAPFQDNKVNKVTPTPTPKPEVKQAAPKAAVTTIAPKPQKAATQPEKAKTEPQPEPVKPAPTFDSSQLSDQISSLEAELANEQQLYAKRPRIYRLNPTSTTCNGYCWKCSPSPARPALPTPSCAMLPSAWTYPMARSL